VGDKLIKAEVSFSIKLDLNHHSLKPSTPSKGKHVPAKIFNEIFVTLVDNKELDPMKLEARIYKEAKNCFSKLENNFVSCEEVGNDLYVSLKM
jgi:hypothetical protein